MNIIRQRNPEEASIIPNGDATIAYRARIGAVVQFPVLVDLGKGYVEKTFEKYVRPPGSRIIAVRDRTILLNKEHRLEIDGYDWRLPGGKVFDSFDEYEPYALGAEDIPVDTILAAAAKELHEEAHLRAASLELYKTKACGTTVSWDLHYVVATELTEEVSTHEEGEDVIDSAWRTFEEIEAMCKSGEIGEGRSVAALLTFIESKR